MKKVIYWVNILCLITVIFSGCKSNIAKDATPNNIKGKIHSEKVINKTGLYSISIEPKIELLGIVQYLADDRNIVKSSDDPQINEYANDIKKYFSKFKDEPVVKLYKEMNKKDFAYDTPPRVLLYVDDNLNFIDLMSLPDDIIQNSGGKDSISKFLYELANFKKKSKFNIFFNSHRNLYTEIVSGERKRLNKIDCINKLINYYGYKQNSYNIIIEPLAGGGYATMIPNENSKFDLYAFVSIDSNDIDLANLTIHEFGHSYVNSLTDKYKDKVDKLDYLFVPIQEKISSQGYEHWNFCVNELMVRAVTYRILNNSFGNKVSQEYIKRDTNQGFIYINTLYNKLDEFENNRNKYPTFSDFYPILLDSLK